MKNSWNLKKRDPSNLFVTVTFGTSKRRSWFAGNVTIIGSRWHFSFSFLLLFFSALVRHERILVNVYRAASFEETGLIVKHTSVAFRLSTTWVKFNSSRAFSDHDNAFARTRRENQLFVEGTNTPSLFSLRHLESYFDYNQTHSRKISRYSSD